MLLFDRQQILAGELWRIWTAHFVHLNLLHLFLNAIAALFIYFAFNTKIQLLESLALVLLFSPLIGTALLYFYPELSWYSGLSGLLHALAAYGSIRMIQYGNKVYWLGVVIVWLKVLIEVLRTALGYEQQMGDMVVITEAHLIGVIVGTVAAVMVVGFSVCKGRRCKEITYGSF